MKIDIHIIMNGGLDESIVWVCHYNRPDMNKKPLRNVPPTKVKVRSNVELPKGKRIYYSESHFSVLNSKGSSTSKILSPVDNTGYRSYCGNTLHVFDTESECIVEWNEQLNSHIKVLSHLIATASEFWVQEQNTLLTAIKSVP